MYTGVSITFEVDAWANQCKKQSLKNQGRVGPAVRGKFLTNDSSLPPAGTKRRSKGTGHRSQVII